MAQVSVAISLRMEAFLTILRRAMPATQDFNMISSRLFCKIDGAIQHHPKTKEVTHEKTYRKVFRSRQG